MKHLNEYNSDKQIDAHIYELYDIFNEINYEIFNNKLHINITKAVASFTIFRSEIEKVQRSYWYINQNYQDKIDYIKDIILVTLIPENKNIITYDDIKEYVEISVEYMKNNKYNYFLEPVWKYCVGLSYHLGNINEISDKILESFHIKFYK